jgi:hypothetical protein
MFSERQKITSIGDDVGKKESLSIDGRNLN